MLAADGPERQRVLVRDEDIRVDLRSGVEVLAEPSLARLTVGRDRVARDGRVGEDERARKMARRDGLNRGLCRAW